MKKENIENKETSQQFTGVYYALTGNLLICNRCNRIPVRFDLSQRGSVEYFSGSSCMRMRRYLRETVVNYSHMVTLTYPAAYPLDGKLTKIHLSRFLQETIRYAKKFPSIVGKSGDGQFLPSVFWFLEFQKRGAPHYHLFTNFDLPYKWVANTWFDIVDSEDERHRAAGTRVETLRCGNTGVASYASKYAAKAEQKDVPGDFINVGRFWGVRGKKNRMSAAIFIKRSESNDADVLIQRQRMEKAMRFIVNNGHGVVLKKDPNTIVIKLDQYGIERMRLLLQDVSMSLKSALSSWDLLREDVMEE